MKTDTGSENNIIFTTQLLCDGQVKAQFVVLRHTDGVVNSDWRVCINKRTIYYDKN